MCRSTNTSVEGKLKLGTGPDPMLAFIWFETALVFGAQIPLLLPLLSIQLWLDSFIYEANSSAPQANRALPFMPEAVSFHVGLVVFLQASFTTFFWLDSGLSPQGTVVTCAVPLIYTTYVSFVAIVRCRRRREGANVSKQEQGLMAPDTGVVQVEDEIKTEVETNASE